jgi:hypothetical protein
MTIEDRMIDGGSLRVRAARNADCERNEAALRGVADKADTRTQTELYDQVSMLGVLSEEMWNHKEPI